MTNTFIYSWKNIGLFNISGTDAERYLQGRLTQDIKSLEFNKSKLSLILTPQGKIEGKFCITKKNNDFLILTDPFQTTESKELFLKSLLKFKVADQLEIEDLSNSALSFSIIFENEEFLLPKILKIKEFLNENSVEFHFFKSIRANLNSFDFICFDCSESIIETISNLVLLEVITEEFFLFLRIQASFPLMEVEIDSSILAPDIPITEYISNTKGCYAGQEVVEMATARGRANRKLIQFNSNDLVTPTVPCAFFSVNENIEVGFITSYSNYKGQFLSLGFIKTKYLEEKEFYLLYEDKKINLELVHG
jgi:folate-binding protein YgfZ